MPKISLIIPLYNAVRHLRACLDSVTAQNFDDFEAVLVNDGSTDQTLEIVDEYCKKYPHFRLIVQENAGVSAARNRGIAETKSPFIAFLDQDDILHPQALEILYQMISEKQADVSVFQIRFVPDDFAGDPTPENFDSAAVVAGAYFSRDPSGDFFRHRKGAPIYIWNKLYRRSAIEGIEFPLNVQPAEDTVFTLKVLLTVKNIISTDAQLLYYRENAASVSKEGITAKYIRSHALAAEEMQRFFSSRPIENRRLREHLDFYLSRFIFKSLISQPLRLIVSANRMEQLEKAREFAEKLYQNGALKPQLLGWKKAWVCKLYIQRHYRAAKFLV